MWWTHIIRILVGTINYDGPNTASPITNPLLIIIYVLLLLLKEIKFFFRLEFNRFGLFSYNVRQDRPVLKNQPTIHLDFWKQNPGIQSFVSGHTVVIETWFSGSSYLFQFKDGFSFRNGILLPKLFWPTLRKHCSRSLEPFIQTVKEQNAFLTCSWRFPRLDKLEQLKLGLRNMQEK